MHFKSKYNLYRKIHNYFLRKALFNNRERFLKEGMPSYAGLINEYISIDIMVDGVYDLKSINEILQLLKSDNLNFKFDTLIDIGANIGNHSVYLSKYFKNVIAFEPNPFTFEILRLNTYQYSNIKINNFGLSSSEDSVFLSEDKRNLGGSQIYNDKNDIPSNLVAREISLKKLDDLNIDASLDGVLIKLDVEGHEIHALKGSKNFINKYKPVICFEQHEEDFINSTSETIDFLSDLNYDFFLFNNVFDSYKFMPLRVLLKLLFQNTYIIKKTPILKPGFYDSIIAIHKDYKI